MPVIKLLELCTPIFAAKPVLMFPDGVGKHIRQMARDVFASFRRRLPDSIKSSDLDVRRSLQTGRIKVRREEQPELRHDEGVVRIAKGLSEIIHSSQHLIRQSGRDNRVQHNRVVRYVNRSDLVVKLEFRSCLREGRSSYRSFLVTLS